MYEEFANELADLDNRLTEMVEVLAGAVDELGRDSGMASLILAIANMTPADVTDLAFVAVMRLTDEKVAAGE